MKKSELKQLIKEEVQSALKESTIEVTPITDFPYLSKKNPNNKAVKVDLSKDQINLSKSIKPVFVVVKNFDEQHDKFNFIVDLKIIVLSIRAVINSNSNVNNELNEKGIDNYRPNFD